MLMLKTTGADGKIDDVRVYDRALSAEEVRGLYAEGAGPIAHWKFDEGAGSTAHDSAGDNDGTIYGAQWTSGIIGGALDFDGDEDYVDFGDIDELEFGHSNFAISAWFYGTGVYPDFDGVLVSKYNYDNYGRQWYLKQDEAGYVYFYTSPDGSTHELLASQGNAYLNQWVHVVGVRDDSTKRLYLNGVLDNTESTSGVVTGKSSKVYIGGSDHPSGLSRCFSGTIDDVRIYEGALSAEEVQGLYLEGGLPIGHWKFDEGEGDMAYDSAGDNDGTLYGDTSWVAGRVGSNALEFDGVDDYVDLGNDSSLKPPLPITFSAWIKFLENNGTLISLDDLSSKYRGVWLNVNVSSHVTVAFGDGSGWGDASYRRAKTGTTELIPDTWYHVAGIVRGATDMSVYINGADDGGAYSGSGGALAYSSGNASIGTGHYENICFDGMIDDVRLYDRALSGEEIEELYLPALAVSVDIRPGSCPNPVNVKSKGVLPVAILGAEDFDVNSIDAVSVRLAGVEPLRSSYEDVASPAVDGNECPCSEEGPDGYTDLTLKFETQKVVEALGEVNDGDVPTVALTGVLEDGMPIEGMDCILVHGKFKPFNKGDINKSGITDIVDFAMMAESWLESTLSED
jgi:hypothetical protein